jgi:hypothetical protein
MSTSNPIQLSDGDLVTAVARLARGEREMTATLIAHLAELYGRWLHERAGYDSLFTYCVGVLRLSESAAYDRMKAAKVARRYPELLALLADGRVNLTTVRLVAPHLTRANHRERLAAVTGKSKRQVGEVLAQWFPQPDAPASVRKLPSPHPPIVPAAFLPASLAPVPNPTVGGPPAPPGVADGDGLLASVGASVPTMTAGAPCALASLPALEPVKPLSPDRYRITFTGSAALCEKLKLAQDLLRHAVPSGDPAQVFERALDVLVEDLVKRKFALTERPRESRGQAEHSRNIPAEVKRAVLIRDRGGCAFVAPDGHRCGARGFVEFHHVQPYGARGKPTVENISLRCRAHNAYEAEMFYGPRRQYGGLGMVPEAVVPRGACQAAHVFVPARKQRSQPNGRIDP